MGLQADLIGLEPHDEAERQYHRPSSSPSGSAVAGYDLATGIGTPKMAALITGAKL